MEDKLYTAGEIAKIAGISKRAIQFYDKKGILKPTDYSEARYRLYDRSSIEKLQKILMLKYIGFSLEQIKQLINKESANSVNLKESFSIQKKLLWERKNHLERLLEAVESAESASETELWDKLIDVIKMTSDKEKIDLQYQDDRNLKKRINIHDYSTAKTPWMQWVFERLKIQSGMKILEIGCGNGLLWTEVMNRLPENLDILLTDNSVGMLTQAKERLSKHKEYMDKQNIHIHYALEDADKFEVKESAFDLVIANHMLYHVNNRHALFIKIRSMLKKNGSFCCSTVGDNHMKELHQITEKFDPKLEIPAKWMTGRFRLENGKEQLEEVFDDVVLEKQDNDLIVDNVEAIYNYVLSYPGNASEILKERGIEFKKQIGSKIRKDKAIYIHKATGMFLCKIK